jgi:hypothetical protein
MASLMANVRKIDSGMLHHVVQLLLNKSARKRELLDAAWADVDWSRRSLLIPKTKSV